MDRADDLLWQKLRTHTRARIGLGRAGDGLPTRELLQFQLGHARARDAVHGVAEFDRIAAEFHALNVVKVSSLARDRNEYLLRPDLGRRLGRHSLAIGDYDLAIVVADGLSASAVNDHAVATVRAILAQLADWKLAPLVLASNARVAIGDDIASALGAQMVAVLIGERPGLSVANSLGIYLTWDPKLGRVDSERNCISNIHADGLSPELAARKLVWLAREAKARCLTGVMLKENAEGLEIGGTGEALSF